MPGGGPSVSGTLCSRIRRPPRVSLPRRERLAFGGRTQDRSAADALPACHSGLVD